MVPQILVGILLSISLGGIYFGFKENSWREDHEKSV